MVNIPLTLDDVSNPQRLLYIMRQLAAAVPEPVRPTAGPSAQQQAADLTPALLQQVVDEVSRQLSAGGRRPLNITGLPGKAGDAQNSSLLIFTQDPTTTASLSASLYNVGIIATYAGAFYYVKDGNPHTWATVTLAAPANMMTLDTVQTVTAQKTFTPPQIFTNGLQSNGIIGVASAIQSTAGGEVIRLAPAAGFPLYIRFNQSANVGGKNWRFGNTGAIDFTTLEFYNETDGIIPFVLRADGKVGINNSAPGAQLDVGGTIRATAYTPLPTTGTGVEMGYTAGVGTVISYNRAGAGAWVPMAVYGSTAALGHNGLNDILVDAAGNVTFLNKLTSYNGVALTSFGVPVIVARNASSGSSASIPATTLYTLPAGQTGEYRMSYYLVPTVVGAGNVVLNALYTDEQGAQTISSFTLNLNSVNNKLQGAFVLHVLQPNTVQFSITYTGPGTYAYYVLLERLS